jgi:hypothetical protein
MAVFTYSSNSIQVFVDEVRYGFRPEDLALGEVAIADSVREMFRRQQATRKPGCWDAKLCREGCRWGIHQKGERGAPLWRHPR